MSLSINSHNNIFASYILIISIGLIYIALPRFKAAIIYIPVDTAIGRLKTKHAISAQKIPYLIKKGRDSLELFDNSEYWGEVAILKLQQAQGKHGSATATHELIQAQEYFQQSIARAPANSHLWYRLAMDLNLRHAASKAISDALLMSIKTGPYEPGIMLSRLKLCLMMLSEFKGNDRKLLSNQVVLAWNYSPGGFIKNIANEKLNRTFIFLLLNENYPQVLNDMVLTFEKTG